MLKHLPSAAIFCCCFLVLPVAGEKQLQTEEEKLSYVMGILSAQSILQQPLKLDADAYLQAISDVLKQAEMKMSQEEIQQVFNRYREQQLQRQKDFEAAAAKNKAAGETFLAENKTKSGVIELPSGLQYKIIKQGTGKKPTIDDTVVVHYEGSLIDGEVFDSSYARGKPLAIAVNGVIKGWQEALPMMTVGSKWQVYIPAELGYGVHGSPPAILPNSTLIFDVELISIN